MWKRKAKFLFKSFFAKNSCHKNKILNDLNNAAFFHSEMCKKSFQIKIKPTHIYL